MSYKFDDKGLKVDFYRTYSQLFEIHTSILIFVMCVYIDVRNKFDKDNELLF